MQKQKKQAGIGLTSRQCRNTQKSQQCEHHQGIKREQCEQLNEARRSITADLENNSQEGGTVSPLLTAVKLPGWYFWKSKGGYTNYSLSTLTAAKNLPALSQRYTPWRHKLSQKTCLTHVRKQEQNVYSNLLLGYFLMCTSVQREPSSAG